MDDTYLRQLVQFIHKCRWIWDIKLTQLFSKNHLEINFPSEWVHILKDLPIDELHRLPTNDLKHTSLPPSLVEFLSRSTLLVINNHTEPHPLPRPLIIRADIAHGMKLKKQHEVSQLGAFVKEECQQINCHTVLDIGSGLGYLGHCLEQQCDFKVFSVEKESERVTSTNIKRPLSCPVIALNIETTPTCEEQLRDILISLGGNVCMTGLHCCGDLSITLLKLFSSLPPSLLPLLILVPCCYHKRYDATPLSGRVKEIFIHEKVEYLSVYGLRLAAQDTYKSWISQSEEDHKSHQNHVTFRAIAEMILEHEIIKPFSDKLSSLLRKINYSNFDKFSSDFMNQIQQFIPGPLELEVIRCFLTETFDKFSSTANLVEPFTCLQVCMQRCVESLVLLDYLLYLKEMGVVNAKLVNVFDEGISPRSFAIIAKRIY